MLTSYLQKPLSVVLSLALLIAGTNSCSKDGDAGDARNSEYNHKQSVGISAQDIVVADDYGTLLVEIQYTAGAQPEQETVDQFKAFVGSIVDKPNGIKVVETQLSASAAASYSLSQIRAMEDSYRSYYTQGDTLAIYFLFLDGNYNSGGEGTVLGIAHRNTSMTIFKKPIKEYSDGLFEPSTSLLESSVTNHEFGHILGLVNNNIAMASGHQDEAHGHHCDNDECLMYWAVETSDFVSYLSGQDNPPNLDNNCLADLELLR